MLNKSAVSIEFDFMHFLLSFYLDFGPSDGNLCTLAIHCSNATDTSYTTSCGINPQPTNVFRDEKTGNF